MCLVCGVGNASFEDIVPENQFEADEVQSRDVNGINKIEEPVKDGNQALRKQDEISAGYGGDGTTGPENRLGAYERMADGTKDRTGQIKAQIADVAEPVVDVAAEQVQKEHISDDVHR